MRRALEQLEGVHRPGEAFQSCRLSSDPIEQNQEVQPVRPPGIMGEKRHADAREAPFAPAELAEQDASPESRSFQHIGGSQHFGIGSERGDPKIGNLRIQACEQMSATPRRPIPHQSFDSAAFASLERGFERSQSAGLGSQKAFEARVVVQRKLRERPIDPVMQ